MIRDWGILLCLYASGCQRPSALTDVPVFEVVRTRFTRVVEANGTLKAARSTPVITPYDAKDALRLVWLAEDGAMVKKGAVVARFDDADFKSHLVAATEDQSSASVRRHKETVVAEQSRSDRRRTTAASERDLRAAQASGQRDTDVFSRDQIIESEIDVKLQGARAEHARAAEGVDQQIAHRKIRVIDVEAGKATEAIRRAKQSLASLEVRAPHDGFFVVARGWRGEPIRVGDTLWPGQPFAELPLVAEMEAEVMVLEAEAAGLANGRRAEVFLASRPEQAIAARVRRVDSVAKRRQRESPTQYFGVTLTLDVKAPPGAGSPARPGQGLRARLYLQEVDALVVPRPALFDRDGRWVVHRRSGGVFTQVVVKLGASTAGRVVIESGLSEHDVVALRDPGRSPDELLSRGRPTGGPR